MLRIGWMEKTRLVGVTAPSEQSLLATTNRCNDPGSCGGTGIGCFPSPYFMMPIFGAEIQTMANNMLESRADIHFKVRELQKGGRSGCAVPAVKPRMSQRVKKQSVCARFAWPGRPISL